MLIEKLNSTMSDVDISLIFVYIGRYPNVD